MAVHETTSRFTFSESSHSFKTMASKQVNPGASKTRGRRRGVHLERHNAFATFCNFSGLRNKGVSVIDIRAAKTQQSSHTPHKQDSH